MLLPRTSAAIAGVLVLASTLSVTGTASAATETPTETPTPASSPSTSPTSTPTGPSASSSTSPAAPPAASRNATGATPAAAGARAVGAPSRNYAMPSGSYFSYPNRSSAERYAIRNRVLYTIQSAYGGPRNSLGQPMPGNGRIRIATWSFNDWAVAKALVAARNRGVSVQIVAAATANKTHAPWKYLQRSFGAYLYKPGHPETRESVSFARQCKGACRGAGGTPHSKFFLFDNVGAYHRRSISIATSMNLTSMGYSGQWNTAQTIWSGAVYGHFNAIFRQMRIGRPVANPYRRYSSGNVVDLFFPYPGGRSATRDPVMQFLNRTRCAGGTRVRVVQYALYGNRGVWIARKLRSLHNAGCSVGIIYSVTSRPVLSILRNRSGRGAVPMRQSVIKNKRGAIVKYNHSKWITVVGNWGGSSTGVTFVGSANFSDLAFGSDEQMQQIVSRNIANRYNANYTKTWKQGNSRPPSFGRVYVGGRSVLAVPQEPRFGSGELQYLSPYGG